VYHIANLRLDLLCQSLLIFDEDIKRKIWTTLEHTLVKHTELMKDRHLDQLLMCSLYIVCKVLGQNKNFTDIMRHYRNQPQAASHVYRSVLLRPRSEVAEVEEAEERPRTSNPPPTPTRLAGTSTRMDGEERGDLIKFYNTVFMECLQEFSLRFKRSRLNEVPPLSPLPKLRAHPQSPCRRLSENHSVFIRPLKSTPNDMVTYNPSSPHKPLSYCFSRSPAKDLKAINDLMRTEGERKTAIGKRLLSDEASFVLEDEPPTKLQLVAAAAGAVNAKLGLVLGDRAQSE
jgi:retinoblastoma-like protein 1